MAAVNLGFLFDDNTLGLKLLAGAKTQLGHLKVSSSISQSILVVIMTNLKPTSQTEKCDFCEEIRRASEACPSDPNKPKLTKAGKIILGVSGVFAVGIYALTVPFLLPALRQICLPFVPATTKQIQNVFTALRGRSGTFIDIGSGDGRITLEAARRGFKAYGIELNTWLVLYSRFEAWRQGLGHTAVFFKRDLWKTDLSSYDNIVIFGVEQMMKQFEEKLAEELPASSCVVACRFPLPSWQPVASVGTGVDTVWLYNVHQFRNSQDDTSI